MDQLEAWLMSRESTLNDETLIDSIEVIDELLRKHADFEKAVDAYAQKFESVKRLTKVTIITLFVIIYLLICLG